MTPMPFGTQHGLHISNYASWSQRQGHTPNTTRPASPPQAWRGPIAPHDACQRRFYRYRVLAQFPFGGSPFQAQLHCHSGHVTLPFPSPPVLSVRSCGSVTRQIRSGGIRGRKAHRNRRRAQAGRQTDLSSVSTALMVLPRDASLSVPEFACRSSATTCRK